MVEEFLMAFITLGLSAVMVVSTLYIVLRLLAWAGDKPLPGAQNRVFSIAFVSLVAVVAMLLLLDIELIATFSFVRESLVVLIEAVDIVASIIVAVLVIITFAFLRAAKRQ